MSMNAGKYVFGSQLVGTLEKCIFLLRIKCMMERQVEETGIHHGFKPEAMLLMVQVK